MNHVEAVNSLACERYLLDEMTEQERHTFEEHFFSCLECADDVRAAAAMRDGVRAGLANQQSKTLPFGPRGREFVRRWRPSVALPWAAAAMLALVVGYQSLSPRSGERRDAGPLALALAPVTLRPATRGEEIVVPPGPGGAITLAVDLGGAVEAGSGGTIRYALKRADGTSVSTGDLPAPRPGAPLLLLIPPGMLRPSDHCVLSLHISGSPALTSEDYRFTVGAP